MTGDSPIHSSLRTARGHAALHTWDKALALYQGVLVEVPDHPGAHRGLADLFRARNDPARAEPHYRAALDADPAQTDAYLLLGDACRDQGHTEAATAAYRQALAFDQDPGRIARARAELATLAGEPHSRCRRCGRFTVLPDFRAAGSGQRRLCPQCFADSQPRRSFWTLLACAAIPFLQLCWLAILHPDPTMVWGMAGNLILLGVTAYALLLPHELGHALVGRLLGARIFEIRLGVGAALWEGRLGATRLSVRRYPWAGYCILGFRTLRGIRWRTMATVLAGTATTAALVLLLLPSYDGARLARSVAPLEVLVLTAAFQTIGNLLPYHFHVGSQVARTDGATLLGLFTGQITDAALHLRYFLMAAQDAHSRRALDEAVALCTQGLAHYPHSTPLRNVKAVTTMRQNAIPAALADFEQILVDFNAGPEEAGSGARQRLLTEAILRNNVAAAHLALDGGAGAPDLVRDLSRHAYEIAPWEPAIESTWGTTLLFQGRPALGLAYLSAALGHLDDPWGRASTLAYIALAHHRLGHVADAGATLDRAQALDADPHTVDQVRALLSVSPHG